MAYLYKRGARWYFRYRDADGKQHNVRGFADKAQTQRLANKREDEKVAIRAGEIDPQHVAEKHQRGLGIEAHINTYEKHLTAKGNNPGSVAYVIADVRRCVAFTGITSPGQLTRSMVDEWVIALEKTKANGKPGDAPKTINRRVASVQQFLRWLKEAGTISRYVLHGYARRHTLGTERRVYRALTPAESAKLIEKAPDAERRDIYRFALATGFRRAEIASMTPASFDFKARTVTVKASDAKAKGRHQVVPMHAGIVEMLHRRCKGKSPTDSAFNVPSRLDAARLLREDCKALGIDTQDVAFHGLRHSYCCRLAEANVHPKILMQLARHSDLSTTMRFYINFRQQDERSAIDALPL